MHLLPEITMQQVVLRVLALVVIVGVHGFALAGLARLAGDRGPAHDGRLSLNPMSHLDLLGSLALVLYQLGWIRPVVPDPRHVRLGGVTVVLIGLGGLLAVLVAAVIAWNLRTAVVTLIPEPTISRFLLAAIRTTCDTAPLFVLLNLVPVPPLTGGLLINAMSPATYERIARHSFIVMVGLAALIVFGIADRALNPLAVELAAILFK